LLQRATRLAFESARPIARDGRDLGIAPGDLRKYVHRVEADGAAQERPGQPGAGGGQGAAHRGRQAAGACFLAAALGLLFRPRRRQAPAPARLQPATEAA